MIRSLAPDVAVIDVCHEIAPHDVRAGGLTLARSAQYLAPGVVLAVVDPGVGTDRRAVAVEVGDGDSMLVGPDNGLLAPAVAMVGGATRAFVLDNTEYHLPAPGPTFAGRDVFAPAAAQLCNGVEPAALGTEIDPVTLLPGILPITRLEDGALATEVLWVDRFGNAQLNVDPDELEGWGDRIRLRIGDQTRTGHRVITYDEIAHRRGGYRRGLVRPGVDRRRPAVRPPPSSGSTPGRRSRWSPRRRATPAEVSMSSCAGATAGETGHHDRPGPAPRRHPGGGDRAVRLSGRLSCLPFFLRHSALLSAPLGLRPRRRWPSAADERRWRRSAWRLRGLGDQRHCSRASPSERDVASPAMNLAAIIDDHPADRPALVDRGATITYGELRKRVAALRAGLTGLGLDAGDRVAIIRDNDAGFVAAYLAILGAGMVAVPLNPQSPEPELTRELDEVGCRAVVVGTGRPGSRRGGRWSSTSSPWTS